MTHASFVGPLRRLLLLAQYWGAHAYGSHAFRRGTARDLWASSRSVASPLAAGEWSTGTFLQYLKSEVVGGEMVINTARCAEDDVAVEALMGGGASATRGARKGVRRPAGRYEQGVTCGARTLTRPARGLDGLAPRGAH